MCKVRDKIFKKLDVFFQDPVCKVWIILRKWSKPMVDG